jgi:hypothetical protein
LAAINEEMITSTLFQGVEKLFLRSPEIIMHGLVLVVAHLTFDQTNALDRFGEKIINQFRSVNAAIRQDADQLWSGLVLKTRKSPALVNAANLLVKALGDKSSSVETKTALYTSLQYVCQRIDDRTEAYSLLTSLLPVIQKEGNATSYRPFFIKTSLFTNDPICIMPSLVLFFDYSNRFGTCFARRVSLLLGIVSPV